MNELSHLCGSERYAACGDARKGRAFMKTLSIDIETYSSTPLQKSGVYRYVEAPDFEILLFGYSVDAGPVQVIDLACGEHIPKEILTALEDEAVMSTPAPCCTSGTMTLNTLFLL